MLFEVLALFHVFQVSITQKILDADSRPGMNGHAIHMGCRNPG